MKRHSPSQTVVTALLVAASCLIVPFVPLGAPAAEPVKHQVVPYDDLHLLAGYYYQNPRKWTEIYSANKSLLDRKPSLIDPGMVLTIPAEGLKPFPVPYAQWKAMVEKK